MNLVCNPDLALHLNSPSQKARIISESWFAREGYCLNCSSNQLSATTPGTVARDFVCPRCGFPYELKSSAKAHVRIVNDGGYDAMMRRIHAAETPALMLLHRSTDWHVQRLVAIHPVFITPEVVRPRKTPHTRPRTGQKYLMCDLDLTRIPSDGKIILVEDASSRSPAVVRKLFHESMRFLDIPIEKRGWSALVLAVLRRIGNADITLQQVYAYEPLIRAAYPNNRHVREKIRQQLQVLRDLGYIEFVSKRGEYRVLR